MFPKDTPLQLEPVLEGKRSSRTLNGCGVNPGIVMGLNDLKNFLGGYG